MAFFFARTLAHRARYAAAVRALAAAEMCRVCVDLDEAQFELSKCKIEMLKLFATRVRCYLNWHTTLVSFGSMKNYGPFKQTEFRGADGSSTLIENIGDLLQYKHLNFAKLMEPRRLEGHFPGSVTFLEQLTVSRRKSLDLPYIWATRIGAGKRKSHH